MNPRGDRRFSVIGREKLVELIDAALDVALVEHGCALTTITKAAIRSTARNSFVRSVGEHSRPIPGIHEGQPPSDLSARIRRLLPTDVQADASVTLERKLTDFVLQVVHAERQRAIAETESLTERYERRLSKVSQALDHAEQGLERLTRAKPNDEGLASLYREVQGLDAKDELHDLKRTLLKNIFEANLVLSGDEHAGVPFP